MATVDQLKVTRYEAKLRAKAYSKRGKQVKSAYSKVNDLDEHYTRIRSEVDRCVSELSNGIKGVSCLAAKCNDIIEHGEKRPLSGQKFSEAIASMSNEINRCEEIVGEANRCITRCEIEIKEQGGTILPWE